MLHFILGAASCSCRIFPIVQEKSEHRAGGRWSIYTAHIMSSWWQSRGHPYKPSVLQAWGYPAFTLALQLPWTGQLKGTMWWRTASDLMRVTSNATLRWPACSSYFCVPHKIPADVILALRHLTNLLFAVSAQVVPFEDKIPQTEIMC